MQINGYNSGFNSYNLKPQNVEKPLGSEVSKTTKTEESQKLTEAEEMEVFKKELYGEIAKINGQPPSYQLSMSISITDGAFEKMKQDSNFKAEVMNDLKKNSLSNPQMAFMPFNTHATTTVKEDGVYTYISHVYDDDSQETKDDKKTEADKKAKDAFYYEYNNKNNLFPDKIYA